jgi:DNA-binding NarL/FixJ family response regulator
MEMSPDTVKRVLIIEDQLLFGKALALILAADPLVEVVGDARRISEDVVRASRPDLVMIDIDVKDIDIAAAVSLVRSIAPATRICVLSDQLTRAAVERCREAGVHGFIVKDVAVAEFRRAMEVVAHGGSYVDPRLPDRETQMRRSDRRSTLLDLSIREGEVVRYIVDGLANKEIASKLSLSEKTVKNHVSRIFSKFDCTARTQVAVQAIRSGLV